jgi:FtsP/CotA-like multicopper oxidase with cupredoxin domain
VPVLGALSRGFSRNAEQDRLAPRLGAGICLLTACLASASLAREPDPASDLCPRPEPGSAIAEPQDLRSSAGVLKVDLALFNSKQPDGSTRYCYVTPDGAPSPTLRVKPGDQLILRLRNNLVDVAAAAASTDSIQDPAAPVVGPICVAKRKSDPCTSGAMTPISTNLHFHGMTVPPVCHQDDVIKTSIQPDDPPFEYRMQIPADQPPGLYWYHPHIHGFSKSQVLGGASGALIVEGIERANRAVSGLPERVLIIRDQELLNPDAPPAKSEPVVPKNLVDNDGDAVNTGTGFGKPSKDLSINFVPVPYPDYPPAALTMKPRARELWRVLNGSAITYLNLAVLFRRTPQPLGIVAIDGVPINFNGSPGSEVKEVNHIGIPPGARAEFIVEGPSAGVPALLVTRSVDTGPGGENDPNRALASIVAVAEAPELPARLSSNPVPLPPAALPWVGDGNGNPKIPPENVAVFTTPYEGNPNPDTGTVSEIENPNPAQGTNNWYTEDGYGGGGFGKPVSGGGSYSNCSDPSQPGVKPILECLQSLNTPIDQRCQPGHYYLLNNYNPGWFGNGNNAYIDQNPANTPFTIPPSSVPSIGDKLNAKKISWKYYGDQWNNYVGDPYQENYGTPGPTADEYCNICNPFQYDTSIMSNPEQVKAHIQDSIDLYADLKNGTLPAVSFVKPSGYTDGHPASSKLDLFEGFTKKIVDLLQESQYSSDTVVFITFDEGGGYYDSGFVQPLDFFGDGTRIPLIVVSPFAKQGYVSHEYADHVSIIKFINRNWNLTPITYRSRDNFPNPVTDPSNPYVPINTPAISDLFDFFNFSQF